MALAILKAGGKEIQRTAFPLLGVGAVGLDKNGVKKQIEKPAKQFPELEVILCLKEV